MKYILYRNCYFVEIGQLSNFHNMDIYLGDCLSITTHLYMLYSASVKFSDCGTLEVVAVHYHRETMITLLLKHNGTEGKPVHCHRETMTSTMGQRKSQFIDTLKQ